MTKFSDEEIEEKILSVLKDAKSRRFPVLMIKEIAEKTGISRWIITRHLERLRGAKKVIVKNAGNSKLVSAIDDEVV